MSLTPEQQAIRATGIGGSEIGILAGLSRWGSPIDVYERKLGLRPDETNFHMERGVHFEPAIIGWYEARTGKKTLPGVTMKHPTLARVIATPDAIVLADDMLKPEASLEAKMPNHRTWHEWGEPGTDEAPPSYLAQCTWEAACVGVQRTDLAAIIDGDLAVYPVAFDPDFFGQLVEIANAFWRDHIEKKVPPAPDGSESYAKSIARRFPGVISNMIEANAEAEELAQKYRDARAKQDAAEAEAERLKQELQQRIGDAKGLVGSFGSISWSETKGRESLDTKALKEAHPDIVAKFLKRGASFRTFRANFKEAV
jgi:putative phage-type endonuclease